jgi:pyrroline-5-carboxylate reductase
MEAMQAAGAELGLDMATARRLTLQTALGAARMAIESDIEPAQLRARVTSKGGTTERAIDSFNKSGFQQQVLDALRAAHARSLELAEELGKDTIS